VIIVVVVFVVGMELIGLGQLLRGQPRVDDVECFIGTAGRKADGVLGKGCRRPSGGAVVEDGAGDGDGETGGRAYSYSRSNSMTRRTGPVTVRPSR
jgi:hypothetical protein